MKLKAWTKADDKLLRELRTSLTPLRIMALKLARTQKAVSHRLSKLYPQATKLWPLNRHQTRILTLGGERVAVDVLILPTVRKLNRLGIPTNFSCQGDQRKADHKHSQFVMGGYLSLSSGAFPESLRDDAIKAGFKITRRHLSVSQDPVGPGSRDAEARARWVCAANRRFIRVLQRWAESK